MNQLPRFGTAISEIVPKTVPVYAPLLANNAAAIRSTSCKTFQYGAHSRQALDVYYPSSRSVSSKHGRTPVLVTLYGGGLVRGEKNLGPMMQGLVYANAGHFFAEKYGYITVFPDYRLLSHGAKFPSGGEDVAQVVDWLTKNADKVGGGPIDLFIMGNSAGGIHLSTFLLAPHFEETRASIRKAADGVVTLRGVVMLSVPMHFENADASRAETLETYYGDRVKEDCPLGLLKASKEAASSHSLKGIPSLVLTGTLDPEDEILISNQDSLKEWDATGHQESKAVLKVETMEGHNHISPLLALGTGIAQEEAWGDQVGSFIDSIRA